MQDQRNSRQRRSAKETKGNQGEYEKQEQNPKCHHYRTTSDGDQALISPFPSKTHGNSNRCRKNYSPCLRNPYTRAGGQLMGIKKWAQYPTRQAQRNGGLHATPRPLHISAKQKPGSERPRAKPTPTPHSRFYRGIPCLEPTVQHCSDPASTQTIQEPTAQLASSPGPAKRPPHAPAQFQLKKASSVSIVL